MLLTCLLTAIFTPLALAQGAAADPDRDRDGLVEDASYRFVCRNQGDGNQWQVADGVLVPSRQSTKK